MCALCPAAHPSEGFPAAQQQLPSEDNLTAEIKAAPNRPGPAPPLQASPAENYPTSATGSWFGSLAGGISPKSTYTQSPNQLPLLLLLNEVQCKMLELCFSFFSMLEHQVFSTRNSKTLEPKRTQPEKGSVGRAHLTTAGCWRGAMGHPHYCRTSPGGSRVLTRGLWASSEPISLLKP